MQNHNIMIGDLAQQAIQAALRGNWKKARDLNISLLENDSSNIDALNRLARAYAELGDFENARKTAKKSLTTDPFNQIAKNALEKWKDRKNVKFKTKTKPSSSQVFLEEPGKTKIVNVLNLGSRNTILGLVSGEEVTLNTHSHLISVCTTNNNYVGKLSDVLSSHLKNLISHGNEYTAYIKSANSNEVTIIIRETKRAIKLKDIPSFSTEKLDHFSLA